MGKAIYLWSRLVGTCLYNHSGVGKGNKGNQKSKSEKTLPNAKARSYWNKRSRLHLVRCSHRLEGKEEKKMKRKGIKEKGKERS